MSVKIDRPGAYLVKLTMLGKYHHLFIRHRRLDVWTWRLNVTFGRDVWTCRSDVTFGRFGRVGHLNREPSILVDRAGILILVCIRTWRNVIHSVHIVVIVYHYRECFHVAVRLRRTVRGWPGSASAKNIAVQMADNFKFCSHSYGTNTYYRVLWNASDLQLSSIGFKNTTMTKSLKMLSDLV